MAVDLTELIIHYQPLAFMVLFIWLLRDTRASSREREKSLLDHNLKTLEGFEHLEASVSQVATDVADLDRRVERLEQVIMEKGRAKGYGGPGEK